VIPDGRLTSGGQHVATFEAKYARFSQEDGPPREHVFQAIATAAAAGSPLAVLVYPDLFEPISWRVHGFGDRPSTLAAIGLGLFAYQRGGGDVERGQRLLALVDGVASSAAEALL
jgi:hypothetical protein